MYALFCIPPKWADGREGDLTGWHGLPLGEPPRCAFEGDTYWFLGLFSDGDGELGVLLPLLREE